ncbi:MAG: hypothetical protein KGZ30_00645 [Anaplasmataceae bacterium]|nr:hypothetical protein [Anaplasmataceae bacterium]
MATSVGTAVVLTSSTITELGDLPPGTMGVIQEVGHETVRILWSIPRSVLSRLGHHNVGSYAMTQFRGDGSCFLRTLLPAGDPPVESVLVIYDIPRDRLTRVQCPSHRFLTDLREMVESIKKR